METNSQYPIIAAENIDQSIEFYTTHLGYHIKHTAITKLNTKVVVLENTTGQQLDLVEATGPVKKGLNGLRMNVKDIDKAYDEIKASGCKIMIEPVKTNTGISFTFKDSNDVSITLIQHIKNGD